MKTFFFLLLFFGLFFSKEVHAQVTFIKSPIDKQVYQRDNTNRCGITIKGFVVGGSFIRIKIYNRVDFLPSYSSTPTIIDLPVGILGNFNYTHTIDAQLTEWKYEIYSVNGTLETLVETISDVVCGEVFAVCGQSNANAGIQNIELDDDLPSVGCIEISDNFRYIRAYGSTIQLEVGLSTSWSYKWGTASAQQNPGTGLSYFAGGWPLVVQKEIHDLENIPIGVLNFGWGGTSITEHLPTSGIVAPPAPAGHLYNIYNHMMIQLEESGIKNDLSTIFWYQGEDDVMITECPTFYYEQFKILYEAWKLDLPGLNQIYLFQLHCATGSVSESCNNTCNKKHAIRTAELMLAENLSDVQLITTFGVTSDDMPPDLVHYLGSGMCKLGQRAVPLYQQKINNAINLADDIYPPRLEAVLTNSSTNSIRLQFDHNISVLDNEPSYDIKEFFYDENDNQLNIDNIVVSGNEMDLYLNTSQNFPSQLTYLPNSTYNNSVDVDYFFGPWIMNSTNDMAASSYYKFPIINLDVLNGGWFMEWGIYNNLVINECNFTFAGYDNKLKKSITIGSSGCVNIQPIPSYIWFRATDFILIQEEFTVPLGAVFIGEIRNPVTICEDYR